MALVDARRRRGISQAAAASAAGVDSTRLSAVERGRVGAPNPEFIDRLSQAIGLSREERDELVALASMDRMMRDAERSLPAHSHGLLDACVAAAYVLAGEDLRQVEDGLRQMLAAKVRLGAFVKGVPTPGGLGR